MKNLFSDWFNLRRKYQTLKVEYVKRAVLEIENHRLVRENKELSSELEKLRVQNQALRRKVKQTTRWNRG